MDRRLLILMRLREERAVTAHELAEACECSVRTIYRDIDALCAAGVPVAAMAGEGYRVVAGYRLPPIAFTVEEATQLLLGAELAPPLGTADQRTAARSGAAKVEAALDDATRLEVERWRERISVASDEREAPSPWLPDVLRSVLDDRVLRIRYHAFGSDEVTEREVEPYHLFYGEDWYLVGYCRLRQGGRVFRTSRIQHAEVLPERVERRATSMVRQERDEPVIEVRVWIDARAVPWARGQTVWGFVREEPAESGSVFVVRTPDLRQLLPWILRWGGAARVLSPPDLVERLREEVEAMSRVYQWPPRTAGAASIATDTPLSRGPSTVASTVAEMQ